MLNESNTPVETKYCPHCKLVLPASRFGRNCAAYDGLQSQCKPCRERYRKRKYHPCPMCGKLIEYRSSHCHGCAKQVWRQRKYEAPGFVPPNPDGYCLCGCGQKTEISTKTSRRVSAVKGLPLRFVEGHHRCKADPLAGRYKIEDRGYFKGPCWIWTHTINAQGYGVLANYGKNFRAHRLSYTVTCGPIPKGMFLDHMCNQKACINPDHLSIATPAQNTRRIYLRSLTMKDIAEIRALCAETSDDNEVLYLFQDTRL